MCKNPGCERARVVSLIDPKILHAFCEACERHLMRTGQLPEVTRQPRWMRRSLGKDFTGAVVA